MTGDQLRRLRKTLGLTQLALAEKMGTTSTTVARWERGEMAIWEPIARYVNLLVQTAKRPPRGRRKGCR